MNIKGLTEFINQATNLREEVEEKAQWYEEQPESYQESDKGQDALVLLDQLQDILGAIEELEYES